MIVRPSDILPTQDFLKPGTIQYIFACIREERFDDLPPSPVLRYGENEELLAIDGHNLIAVNLFLGKDMEVHLAQSREDGLKDGPEKSYDRNNELRDKYSEVLVLREDTVNKGIGTFQDLIDKYAELFRVKN